MDEAAARQLLFAERCGPAPGRRWQERCPRVRLAGRATREADWLAGVLLIPNEAAHAAARGGRTDEEVAEAFGVSGALATWRMRMTEPASVSRGWHVSMTDVGDALLRPVSPLPEQPHLPLVRRVKYADDHPRIRSDEMKLLRRT